MTIPVDRILVLIAILLTLSVSAFLGGVIPYPFGIIVISAFLIARIIHLSGKR